MVLMLLSARMALAGFESARVKVTGVTCSMCSNSVNKALSSLTFVESVEVDLVNAVFNLRFRTGHAVSADQIGQKVEGAGFSVGLLVMEARFENLEVKKDLHYEFEGNTYHFVDVPKQLLNGKVALRFVDKGLSPAREHKKYCAKTSYQCIRTGKMESCCEDSVKGRIYHVTL